MLRSRIKSRKTVQVVVVSMVILSALLNIEPKAFAEDGVYWFPDIQVASAEALKSNKPMLVDFWAEWCAACKVMEKEVYTSQEFFEASKRFLTVKIDFDKKTAIARKYGVEALPTLVFTDSYGNELYRYRGYMGSKLLLAVVKALPGDVSEFNRLNQALAKDKDNFGALEEMASKLRAANLYIGSNDFYAKALKLNEAKSNPAKREAILNEMGLNYLDIEDIKQASETFQKCLKEFPTSSRKPVWTVNMGRAYSLGEKKDKDKAKKILESFLKDNPTAPEADEAKKLLASL